MGLCLAILRTRLSIQVMHNLVLKVTNFFAEFYTLRLLPGGWPIFLPSLGRRVARTHSGKSTMGWKRLGNWQGLPVPGTDHAARL
jgi:hypothetical protein